MSTVDETIEKKKSIIEKIKELKKGLMQELLTRGIGHTKFKKTELGEIPEEWDVLTLKDVGEIITGNTPPTKYKEYYNGNYLWATPADLGNSKYIKSTHRMITDKGLRVIRPVPENSILVVCIGSTIGKVGMASTIMATNQQINSIICNPKWNHHFVYYWLEKISDYLVSLSGKHAIPILNKTLFSFVLIPKPSKNEQEIIGTLLDSVDEVIENEKNYCNYMMIFKRALMRMLLIGKIRVRV